MLDNGTMAILDNIVGRCHVSESLRHVACKVSTHVKGWSSVDRGTRAALLRYARKRHAANRQLFKDMRF